MFRGTASRLAVASGLAFLLALSPGAALAAEATGFIQYVDAEEGWILLDTGDRYTLAEGVLGDWQVGHRVTVTYEGEGDQMRVTAIAAPESGG